MGLAGGRAGNAVADCFFANAAFVGLSGVDGFVHVLKGSGITGGRPGRWQYVIACADELDQNKITNVSVAEAPIQPQLPISPNRPLNLVLGLFLGLLLGVGSVVIAIVTVLGPGYRLTALGLWGAGAVNWLYLTAVCYGVAQVVRWRRARRPHSAATA